LQADPGRAGVSYDKEFIVCSLDLLSGLAEGLGSSIESLVSRSDLFDLLLLCCADEAPDIRQSALALLGDLAKVNIVFHFCVLCPSDLLWETCAVFSRRYCTSSICIAVIYGGL
jgi:hypothetical protein